MRTSLLAEVTEAAGTEVTEAAGTEVTEAAGFTGEAEERSDGDVLYKDVLYKDVLYKKVSVAPFLLLFRCLRALRYRCLRALRYRCPRMLRCQRSRDFAEHSLDGAVQLL
jgi:hypothetical protein